jgi:hypothetical protein
MFPRWLCAQLVFALAALLMTSGCCRCGKKTDEEILRERIDTTSVHLYLATKVAITKADAPEAVEARRQLVAILEVLAAARKDGAPPPDGAAPVVPAATPTKRPEIGAAELAKLATALWLLRSEGKALLEEGHEDDLPPILPILLQKDGVAPELVEVLDVNTEHALFLSALFALKFHAKSPVPVPPEILLYEAWRTRADAIRLEGFGPMVHAIKAVVYGTNELCDLAAVEGGALGAAADAAKMSASLRKLGGTKELDAKEAAMLGATARALAHGVTAKCFLDRDERDKALAELERFVAAAHEAGVPHEETALLRAYIAYEQKDYDRARGALVEARDAPSTDPETRRDIDELLADFASKDDGAVEKYFNKAYFTAVTAKIVLTRLERSGVFDDVKETRPIRALHDFVFAAVSALGGARDAIPSASGIVDRLKR